MNCRPGIALLIAALTSLGGCAYTGDDIGNPFYRKAQWFSFVGGDDIAGACAAGTPDRFRLVYNALWDQQVRIYEWDSAQRQLKTRVVGSGNVAEIRLDDPITPWRAEEIGTPLEPAAYDGLVQSLSDSGAFAVPDVGLELPSHSYYWTTASCRRGQFSFTAWRYPSAGFAAASFPARLAALDPRRESIITAGPIPLDPMREYNRNRGAVMEFTLKIGRNGLDYGLGR
ncbi:MAG: hypothetical protein HY055_01070 [Magnetospirillum sp.]|nr:hypothetical protein [Magnetospirillum sp.]